MIPWVDYTHWRQAPFSEPQLPIGGANQDEMDSGESVWTGVGRGRFARAWLPQRSIDQDQPQLYNGWRKRDRAVLGEGHGIAKFHRDMVGERS